MSRGTGKPKNSGSSKSNQLDLRNRVSAARKRLGVTVKQVEGVRKITPSLREAGLNTDRVIEILEGDDSIDGQAFLAKWRTISKSDRAVLSVEEVCIASDITTRRLWEVIAGARFQQAQDSVKLMICENQGKVMQATIKAATDSIPLYNEKGKLIGMTQPDVKAMETFHKITGAMPTPKGSTNVFNFGNKLPQDALPIGDDDEDDVHLPDMDEFLKDLQVTVAPKQLEAPKEIAEVEYEEI